MNVYFKEAEALLGEARDALTGFLAGDPLDCYNPTILDSMIENMIKARSAMAIGRHVDCQEEEG